VGEYDEAEKLLLQTRDIQRRLLGPGAPAPLTQLTAWLASPCAGDGEMSILVIARGHAAWPIPGTGFRNRSRPRPESTS
jgi:hypothetical protein